MGDKQFNFRLAFWFVGAVAFCAPPRCIWSTPIR